MSQILYGLNSLLIAAVLFVTMVAAIEVGYRLGRSRQASVAETTRTHVNAIQASLLGILALVLGFTFSLSLQRFESRNVAVVDEANAIGTTWLRAQLLPNSVRADTLTLLQHYVDLRVQANAISYADEAGHRAVVVKVNHLLDALWGCARRLVEEERPHLATGQFVQALNTTIDSFRRDEAALRRQVPEAILFLLYLTFLLASGVVGYAAGNSGHRPPLVAYILVTLIVILSFIIVDLDRPQRGLIRTDQRSLTDLKAAIDAAQATGAGTGAIADPARATVLACR